MYIYILIERERERSIHIAVIANIATTGCVRFPAWDSGTRPEELPQNPRLGLYLSQNHNHWLASLKDISKTMPPESLSVRYPIFHISYIRCTQKQIPHLIHLDSSNCFQRGLSWSGEMWLCRRMLFLWNDSMTIIRASLKVSEYFRIMQCIAMWQCQWAGLGSMRCHHDATKSMNRALVKSLMPFYQVVLPKLLNRNKKHIIFNGPTSNKTGNMQGCGRYFLKEHGKKYEIIQEKHCKDLSSHTTISPKVGTASWIKSPRVRVHWGHSWNGHSTKATVTSQEARENWTSSNSITAHISRAAVWQENAIDLERLGIGMIGSCSRFLCFHHLKCVLLIIGERKSAHQVFKARDTLLLYKLLRFNIFQHLISLSHSSLSFRENIAKIDKILLNANLNSIRFWCCQNLQRQMVLPFLPGLL